MTIAKRKLKLHLPNGRQNAKIRLGRKATFPDYAYMYRTMKVLAIISSVSGPVSRLKAILLLLFLGVVCSGAAYAAPEVIDVRLGGDTQKTRFVLEVKENITYSISVIPDPYRVIVDVSEVDWKDKTGGEGKGRGLVQSYRYGLIKAGTSRIVLDLKEPVRVTQSFMIPPRGGAGYRLVVDLAPASRETFMKNVKTPAEATDTPPDVAVSTPTPPTQMSGKKLVVIDPGHGGVDPGSPGVAGLPEKSVTLASAKVIRDALNATGRYRAVLTRDSDIFIPLRQRFQIARRQKADLFISLHADSHANNTVRGATVYTLSEKSSDREAAALAAKENKSDVIAGIDLGGETREVSSILIDLAQRETMNYSSHLANLLVTEFKDDILVGRNGHRFAGFMVLKAPDIPSVLVEMGYISNQQDAQLLASPPHQKKLAGSFIRAVDAYFTKVATK